MLFHVTINAISAASILCMKVSNTPTQYTYTYTCTPPPHTHTKHTHTHTHTYTHRNTQCVFAHYRSCRSANHDRSSLPELALDEVWQRHTVSEDVENYQARHEGECPGEVPVQVQIVHGVLDVAQVVPFLQVVGTVQVPKRYKRTYQFNEPYSFILIFQGIEDSLVQREQFTFAKLLLLIWTEFAIVSSK